MIRAVNEGVPVASSRPGSPVALAMQKVAQAIAGIETQAPPTKGSGQNRERRGGLLFGRR
jgi:MinD-like ATPase involved in chromosome partitioning or flagellar assembly